MASDHDWKVQVTLGEDVVVAGRIRRPDGHVVVGDARRSVPDYERAFEWLLPLQRAAESSGGRVRQQEIVLSRRVPDRDAGRLRRGAHGYFGGTEIHLADVALATWTAVGGASGVVAFLKLLKELRGLWSRSPPIEVTLRNGTKLKFSNERDIDMAIKAIQKLEAEVSENAGAAEVASRTGRQPRRTKPAARERQKKKR